MGSRREHLKVFLLDCQGLVSGAIRVLHRSSRVSLVFWVFIAALVAVAHLADGPLVAALSPPHSTSLNRSAVALSRWGDYGTGILIVSIGLWLAGTVVRNDKLRRTGVACFLAATLALLSVNIIKSVSGRPRPYAGMSDTFTGLNTEEKLRSFPSGHSATAMATAATISVACPVAAAPAVLIALGVAWSRMYLAQHYLTDVIVGGALGMWLGIALGLATRRVAAKNGRGT